MSEAALKAAKRLDNSDWRGQTVPEVIDQAADEKYRPLVEAAKYGLNHLEILYGDTPWVQAIREALRKVKEG